MIYSDKIIEAIHFFRNLFKGCLRKLEGFINGLFKLLKLSLPTPDHTTLSIRLEYLDISNNTKIINKEKPITVIMDSSGIKISEEKEWIETKYGDKAIKSCSKLHLAVSESG